jgi:hypothetical protein
VTADEASALKADLERAGVYVHAVEPRVSREYYDGTDDWQLYCWCEDPPHFYVIPLLSPRDRHQENSALASRDALRQACAKKPDAGRLSTEQTKSDFPNMTNEGHTSSVSGLVVCECRWAMMEPVSLSGAIAGRPAPRPGAGDEREGPSPQACPRFHRPLEKDATLADRPTGEGGLRVLQERVERGDAGQTARQQDEEHDAGTPYLSGGQTIQQKDRHRQHFEHDAGRH